MAQPPLSLSGRVALVTGGGRGIGAAIVTRFAEAGATVVAANRTLDVAEDLARALRARGLSVRAAGLDGLGRTEMRALVDGCVAEHGRIDIVVHNAGGCRWATVEDMDEATLDGVIDVNLKPCFWLAQAAIPHMRARAFGRILVTSSVSARVAMAGGAHYSAAKAGVNAFIRGCAFELARDGITVNGVGPGFIRTTELIAQQWDNMGPAGQAAVMQSFALRRMGSAADVAHAVMFLASDYAGWITGQNLLVDGGSGPALSAPARAVADK